MTLVRGCIGSLVAHQPLGKDVIAHAVDAATRDPRFNPVTAAEYPLLNIEVSVLGGGPKAITVKTRDGKEAPQPLPPWFQCAEFWHGRLQFRLPLLPEF